MGLAKLERLEARVSSASPESGQPQFVALDGAALENLEACHPTHLYTKIGTFAYHVPMKRNLGLPILVQLSSSHHAHDDKGTIKWAHNDRPHFAAIRSARISYEPPHAMT